MTKCRPEYMRQVCGEHKSCSYTAYADDKCQRGSGILGRNKVAASHSRIFFQEGIPLADYPAGDSYADLELPFSEHKCEAKLFFTSILKHQFSHRIAGLLSC